MKSWPNANSNTGGTYKALKQYTNYIACGAGKAPTWYGKETKQNLKHKPTKFRPAKLWVAKYQARDIYNVFKGLQVEACSSIFFSAICTILCFCSIDSSIQLVWFCPHLLSWQCKYSNFYSASFAVILNGDKLGYFEWTWSGLDPSNCNCNCNSSRKWLEILSSYFQDTAWQMNTSAGGRIMENVRNVNWIFFAGGT